jgi:superfamily II RNA helicase
MSSIEIKENVILDTGDYNIDEPPEYFKFKYEPDHFQKWGFKAISKNENILVTAHTGAGKTCLALYSIAKWLMEDEENQVIYTSPIKTLSNQKFKEFGEHFNSVGILTGDVKINPTANLLIMTAEILRNSLLRNCNEKVYEWNFNPEKVKCVILDEVHFINNPERGKVWEEIIANLNPSIQLVMLSATISGAENLASWVGKLKSKPCHLIPTPFRPVPLHHYLYYKNDLKCVKDNTSWKEGQWSEVIAGLKKSNKGKYQKNKFNMGQLFESIEYCRNNDIMPVNVFLLNRSLTEEIAKKIPFNLLNHEESSEITKQWNKYLLKYRDIYQETEQWQFLLGLAQKGIGVHHSGIIPILKEIVEILYEQKLIKVLIATETFAMGVNMPTRTVIFTQTTKYDGQNSRPLRPEEYGQMAGRAGRRGIDTFGTVIILPENDMPSESEAKTMITSSPQQISSKLDIDYSFILKRMVLKLEENNDESVVSYLSNSITNTMLADELSNVNNIHQIKLDELSKIDKYDNLSEYFDKFKELKDMENKIKIQQTSFVKLSNKILKKYNQEIKKLESEFGDKKLELEKWYKNLEKIKELEDIIKCSQSRFDNQIKLILDFLIDYNIIYFEDDYKLTPLGRIVSEVNECNPIILGFIISNDYLDNLDFNEIVAFLSIFIADHSIEDPYLSDLNISKNFGEMLDNISDLADKMVCKETEINNQLPFHCWSNWDLHLSMFQVMMEWSKGDCKWNEVKHLYNTFEGNFCRNVLRLVNLLRNVESIALLINNANLLNKLDGYQEKLIRDIVIIDSLYL